MFEFILSWKEMENLTKEIATKKLAELEAQLSKLTGEKNKLKKIVNPFWELEEEMKKNNYDKQTVPYTGPWSPNPNTPWTYPQYPGIGGGTTGHPPLNPTWTTTTAGTATSGGFSLGAGNATSSNHTHTINVVRPRTENEIEGQG